MPTPSSSSEAIQFSISPFMLDVMLTLVLGAALFFAAHLASSVVARNQTLETQRIWRLTFRHLAAVSFLLTLGVIWKSELQAVLLALGAATAGFLIAFREGWLSLLAFWIRLVKRHYGIGDYIEVDGASGKVLDVTWQHTVIAETGPGHENRAYTGRVVHIPNNRLLMAPLAVDNLTGAFSAHIVQIPLADDVDVVKAADTLAVVAEAHCQPFHAQAHQHMTMLEKGQALDTPSIEPKVLIGYHTAGHAVLTLRFVAPVKDKVRVEQAILRAFLTASCPPGEAVRAE